jgi:mRNA interferase MazF
MARRVLIRRGDVCMAALDKRRPVVVVTRDDAIDVLTFLVCAAVTSTFRGHVAEVKIGRAEGLAHDSAVNCDSLHTVPKSALTQVGHLGPANMRELDQALAIALDL